MSILGGKLVNAGQLQTISDISAEMITNAVDRDFSGAGNWSFPATFTVVGGVLRLTAATSAQQGFLGTSFFDPAFVAGDSYAITYTISGYSLGGIFLIIDTYAGTVRTANGTYTDVFQVGADNRINFTTTGASTTLDIDNVSLKKVGATTSGYTALGGVKCNSSGSVYVYDLGANAVPSTAVKLGGIAHTPLGMMYVTTATPSSASFIGGMAVRADGALHVSTDAVAGTDSYVGGIAVTPTGQVKVAIA